MEVNLYPAILGVDVDHINSYLQGQQNAVGGRLDIKY
jgi:hypothetical protein